MIGHIHILYAYLENSIPIGTKNCLNIRSTKFTQKASVSNRLKLDGIDDLQQTG